MVAQGSALSNNSEDNGPLTVERAQLFLAKCLAEEFAAPVGVMNVAQAVWGAWTGCDSARLPALDAEFQGALASVLQDEKRVAVWHPHDEAKRVWLMIGVRLGADVQAVACAGFCSVGAVSDTEGWGPPCPDRALLAWGREVVDRIPKSILGKTSSEAVAKPPRPQGSELQLVSRLIRRLKISDPPERFQNLASFALQSMLGVEAVAWVPRPSSGRVIVSGGIAGWKPNDYRTLVLGGAPKNSSVWIMNEPRQVTPLRKLVAVEAGTPELHGWLLAINPIDRRSFSQAEVEVLEPVASLLSTQQTNAWLYGELKDLLFGVIRALTAAIDAKDPYTSGHSERVARIAVRLAEQMDMSAKQQNDLYLMGILHDIGKIGIDDNVLKKPGPLTDEEYQHIKSHVEIGVNILRDLHKLKHLLPGVHYHHERIDGNGYPCGLAGEEIPFEARILAVADAFDALTSSRPYRDRMPPERIDEIFRAGAGVQWDARVVEALFACRKEAEGIRQKGLGESLQVVIDDTVGRH